MTQEQESILINLAVISRAVEDFGYKVSDQQTISEVYSDAIHHIISHDVCDYMDEWDECDTINKDSMIVEPGQEDRYYVSRESPKHPDRHGKGLKSEYVEIPRSALDPGDNCYVYVATEIDLDGHFIRLVKPVTIE